MKKIGALLSIGILLAFYTQAQDSRGMQGADIKGRFYGKIVDALTNKGIEAASVQIFILPRKGSSAAVSDLPAGGMLTQPNGDFSIENLPAKDSFKLVISAIGFEEKALRIAFPARKKNATPEMGSLASDLGNITLAQDAQFLNSVTVVGQKPGLEMGIDRKIFNVEKNITATGGTAVDIMKNIPSVTVDVDGNVLLRNASPKIFVDGLPTILTLDQIPADNIERIELITNPSAKYDAASSAGIINVVLKKNKRKGFNGIASAGIGSPDITTGNLSLNHREGKINFFVSGSYNRSGGISKGRTFRQNKYADTVVNYFNQESSNDRLRRFQSLRFGVDYFIDNRNTLTISENLVKGRFNNQEFQDQEYFNSNKVQERIGERTSNSSFGFDRSNTQAAWKHSFAKEGKELSADVNYSNGSGSDYSEILNTYFYPDGTSYADPYKVRNEGSGRNNQFTMQLNYTNPQGENGKLETGLRTYVNNFKSLFLANSIDANGVATKLPLSNNYEYREMVNAGYITYSNKWHGLVYQAGLRAEVSNFNGELIDSAFKFGYDYPNKIDNIFDALFPSLFITKTISDGVDIQVNYTRRIRRPDFWQLNPFVDINDPLNLRQGNPQLQPEFTNSIEFNYNNTYNSGNFLGVIYYRNNQRDITRYSDTISTALYDKLQNAGVDPNAILNTYINARSTNRLGLELTLQQRFGKNFDITPSVDLQYRKVNVDQEQLNLSNEGFNWDGKLIVNYTIATRTNSFFNKISFQTIGNYDSREVSAQGMHKARYSVDVAMKKDLFKNNKGRITFSLNDVFNSDRWGSIYDTDQFYQDSYRRRGPRSFRVTFSYKFGDNNFSFFHRNSQSESSQEDPESKY